MHIHKISSSKHSHFLNEQRKDPITGDLILEGDEVVFCATCKSAFLKTSWEYMGKQHCESKKTLYIFPHSKSMRIGKLIPSTVFSFIISEKSKNKIEQVKNIWKKEIRTMSIPNDANVEIEQMKLNLESFDLDKTPILSITLLISLIICVLILLVADLTSKEQAVVFWVAVLITATPLIASFFYSKLFFGLTKTTVKETKNLPILLFENDKLGIYLHDEKNCYQINYKEISHIKFHYPSALHLRNFFSRVEIITINGEEINFELKYKGGNKNHFLKKTKSIIKLISQNSKGTLITFRVSSNKSTFYELNELKNISKNIRIE